MIPHLTLSRASKILGVTTQTLRNWDNTGKITTIRTTGNQRRISEAEVKRLLGKDTNQKEVTLVYCRVSTQKQGDNLERQIGRVLQYCNEQGWLSELYKDIGSGLNDNRHGFKSLVTRVSKGGVTRIVIEYKDRLTRFGFDTFLSFCKIFGTDIIIVTDDIKKEFEQEFAEDVIALVSSYAARLYGKRGGRKKLN